ncbi:MULTISPECIES: VOC family protein [Ornithinimicrobium]|uniref:VOC family protein n=1 Tax=Ornithinimicrobium kibberense TaxID=282060 RepID=A0ABV5V3C9_9MICO|nr:MULTISPECIES: VOC family protein [Ornithinimicrobium]
MPAALDHLVLAVPHLEGAVLDLARRTGVQPVSGGSHPGRGTRNALVGLTWQGERRCYLELLAPDPDQPPVAPEETMLGLGALGAEFVPRLHAWAVRTRDLDATLAAAAAAGVDTGRAVRAGRDLPDGTRLAWRLAVPRPLAHGGVQPFLIAWDGPHPTDGSMPTLELVELAVDHPDPQAVERALAVLDVDVEVHHGPHPRLHAVLDSPEGLVELGECCRDRW